MGMTFVNSRSLVPIVCSMLLTLSLCAAEEPHSTAAASAPASRTQLGVGDGSKADRDLLLAGRVGFGRNADGGNAGETCRVTTDADSGAGSLREALSRPEPLWIIFDGDYTIHLSSGLPVSSRKTIDGRGRHVTLTGHGVAGLILDGVEHVVIENLELRDFGDTERTKFNDPYDAISITNRAHDIWIDHCSLSMAGDKLIGIGGGATDITVSWCRFTDQQQVFQIGNMTTQEADVDTRVTSHHNFFDGTGYRHPVLSYGRAHAFNNYLRRWRTYGMRSERTGQLCSEANIFEAGDNKTATRFNTGGNGWNDSHTRFDDRPGALSSTGDWKINGAKIRTNDPDSVFNPAEAYPYQAAPADEALRTLVEQGAGWQPTLDNSPEGSHR